MTAPPETSLFSQPPQRQTLTPVIEIARSALRGALAKLMSVVDAGRASLPVAQHILIEAKDQRLTFSATNFTEYVRVAVPCSLIGQGTVLLPAKILSEIVSSLAPTGAVTITLGDGRILPTNHARIEAGRSRFNVRGLAPEEFPEYPDVSAAGTMTVRASVLIDALDRIVAHTTTTIVESRAVFQGVLLDQRADALTVIACDGHTLARLPAGQVRLADAAAPAGRRPLIHRSGVTVIGRVFADLEEDADLTIACDGYRLRLDAGDTTTQVRLIEGMFPPYEPLLTDDWTHSVICDRREFSEAIRRAAITTDDSRALELAIDESMMIRAARGDVGDASDWVPLAAHERRPELAEPDADPPFLVTSEIVFKMNATQLTTALQTIRSERIRVDVRSDTSAVFLRNADQAPDDPTVILIQPLRFKR